MTEDSELTVVVFPLFVLYGTYCKQLPCELPFFTEEIF